MSTTQFFELDGVPIRRRTPSSWPEVYRSNGEWEKHGEPVRLIFAGKKISERDAMDLIHRWDRMVAGQAA